MARALVGSLLFVALATGGATASPVPVRVELDGPAKTSAPARVHLQATRTGGAAAGGAPVEAEAGALEAVLELGDGTWHVQASAPGWWSPGAEVVVGRHAPASVRVALWPAASLRGQVATHEGQPLPRDLVVRLSPVTDSATEMGPRKAGPPRAELRCPIDGGAWACSGPTGVFDVQIEAAGYAPRYAWDVRLASAVEADLGRTVLRRAASVFGRVVRSDGSNPQGPCQATLRAEPTTRRGSPEADPEGTSFSMTLSQRGYVHFVGMPPGEHVLAVECPAASAASELRVQAERETRIDPPLRLEELTLEIAITPRLDPHGRPWQLTIDGTAPRTRRVADKAPASTDGRLSRRGLTAGTYRVALRSADGNLWMQRFVDLAIGTPPLSLRLGFVAVAGRVRLREQGLRARLVFVNEAGGEPVTLTSDDEGRFQGTLPVAPDAVESLWTVEAHATQPPVRRRVPGVRVEPAPGEARAWLDLALPIVAVRGTVVSEEGQLQSGVPVTFEDTSTRTRTVAATDDAGSFEVLELPPGSYFAAAESVAGVSERALVEVADGIESELQLVLKRSDRVTFQVIGAQGPVANAAVQIWIAPGIPRSFTQTDADGGFEADLPPGTKDVGLTIGAPGHALRLARLAVTDEATITLGASGGRLVLDLRRPGRVVDDSATLYLVHDGALEAAGSLAAWSPAHATGGEPIVIDPIEPGTYALCLAGPAEVAALWRGGALPSERCRAGSVEPGGSLTLSPPLTSAGSIESARPGAPAPGRDRRSVARSRDSRTTP